MVKPILIVGALKDEISELKGQLKVTQTYHQDGAHFFQGELAQRPVIVGYTGISVTATRAGLTALSERVPVCAVIGVGYAGALVDGLDTGHLVLPREICRETEGQAGPIFAVDGDIFTASRRALSSESFVSEGRLVTVEQARTDAAQKRAAARTFGAVAVDMESAGLAEFCCEQSIPFLVLRAVLDPVHTTVPDPAAFLDRSKRISKRKVASYVMRRPQAVRELSTLAANAKRARQSLNKAIPNIVSEIFISCHESEAT
jgi:adenosylhomocysteine nucleosidase